MNQEEEKVARVYNFSAGPAVLPEEVLREAADEMLDYQGSGQSVMEMSHRSKVYDNIIKEAEKDLRELMNIPDNYKVLFLQGGASQFFAEVPMNLMKNKKEQLILSLASGLKAFNEAKIYGEAVAVASSEDKTYSYIPDCSDLDIPEDADYVYICENNTIYGTKYKTLPNTKGHILVSDVSSCFLSEPIDVTKYGVVYGGVQKNIGPAGVVIAIIREDLITDDVLPGTPTMLKWKTQADADSLYNTPPCYNIYICGKVFKWIKKMGGLSAMKEHNEKKAKILYDFLDESKMFKGTVVKEDRSLMNVPFVTGDKELDAKFVKEAFSYKVEGPLDLRLNPDKGISAAERLRELTRDEIEGMLRENADEPYAEQIAKEIMKTFRQGEQIDTTGQLKEVIERALVFLPDDKEKKDTIKKTCQRTFQALRIDVNSEFEVLEEFLEKLPHILAPGGRVAILTFHSGEDRLVKKIWKRQQKEGLWSEVAKNVIRPSKEECHRNGRARSTKMRWAIK